MSDFAQQLERVHAGIGFLAALDQSGGSTPKALAAYGVTDDAWSNDTEMFDVVHQMRTRVIKSPDFNGDRILGAILFENTMDREIDGKATSNFLWEEKNVVPFLKIDKGLADEHNGVQLMKPIPGLDDLLDRANEKNIFGTKERSVIKQANPEGIKAVVEQQFEIGRQVSAKGIVPILEPEVDIHCPNKAEAEKLLKAEILKNLDTLNSDQKFMLKITIPDEDNFYADVMEHPNMVKVVALSGGYSRDEANEKLARNKGLIASFSRALAEGLSAQQSDDEFNKTISQSIDGIYKASIA